MMTSDIRAPGRSALWTEAAMAALGGLLAGDGHRWDDGAVAERACNIATAFEQACEEQAQREAEERAEADGHIIHAVKAGP